MRFSYWLQNKVDFNNIENLSSPLRSASKGLLGCGNDLTSLWAQGEHLINNGFSSLSFSLSENFLVWNFLRVCTNRKGVITSLGSCLFVCFIFQGIHGGIFV